MTCRCITVVVTFLLVCDSSHGGDLEITIRPHATSILIGEPLFIEVLIANKGNEPIVATDPDFGIANAEFRVCDRKSGLELNCSGPDWGGGLTANYKPATYVPGKPVKHRLCIFAPYTNQLDHPFWKEALKNGQVDLWFVLWLEKKLGLKSDRVTVFISQRHTDELKTLNDWSRLNQHRGDTTIYPSNFGLNLYGVTTIQQTREVADKVKTGQLAGLLGATIQLQEIARDRESSYPLTIALTEWVGMQPDIKRQYLARQISGNYEGLLSPPALHALKRMAEESP